MYHCSTVHHVATRDLCHLPDYGLPHYVLHRVVALDDGRCELGFQTPERDAPGTRARSSYGIQADLHAFLHARTIGIASREDWPM
jgi:hypothetical protein